MKVKPNKKHIALFIVYVITLIIMISDFKNLIFKGGCYTWLGLMTGITSTIINLRLYIYYTEYVNKKSVNASNRRKVKR